MNKLMEAINSLDKKVYGNMRYVVEADMEMGLVVIEALLDQERIAFVVAKTFEKALIGRTTG